jgi:hypothetical protein
MVVGSVVLVVHFSAIGVRALAAHSGMWPSPFGPSMAEPPTFAKVVDDGTRPFYLYPLKLTHNYHFPSNQPSTPDVTFEARFRDKSGKLVTLRFPDPEANFAVQYRQKILAMSLGGDMPVQPGQGELIPPPGGQVRTVQHWEMGPDRTLRLKSVPEHLVPRGQPIMRPSEWALLLADSYARHVCREHGVTKVEIVRRSKDPISPVVLIVPALPGGPPPEIVATFGELPR